MPSLSGETVSLSQFAGKKNVVISFVPAAWTPICSDQWPGYNLAKGLFEANDAVLLGITVDNLPTLYSWTRQMGNLWFPVLSDFWQHGAIADK
ncbi:MAG: redoxin domain-containing protein [Pseudomonadota bacterium]